MTAAIGQDIERDYSLFDLLRRPNVSYDALMALPLGLEGVGEHGVTDPAVAEQVEIAAKYQGYIDRQNDEVEKNRAQESLRLPAEIDYTKVRGLSKEVQLKLNQHKPETVGQAARIQGMTPAAISLLLVYLKRGFSGGEMAAAVDEQVA
jgi:tRNA uridine 5-carboxymethylaminomethyl modification enzyme